MGSKMKRGSKLVKVVDANKNVIREQPERKARDEDFRSCLEKAKDIFFKEMYDKAIEAYDNLEKELENKTSTRRTFPLNVDSKFMRSFIEIKGKTRTFKFYRHELWYGRILNSWQERDIREENCVFNMLNKELQKDELYVYDISDPEKSYKIIILLSLYPFEKRKELWHKMDH